MDYLTLSPDITERHIVNAVDFIDQKVKTGLDRKKQWGLDKAEEDRGIDLTVVQENPGAYIWAVYTEIECLTSKPAMRAFAKYIPNGGSYEVRYGIEEFRKEGHPDPIETKKREVVITVDDSGAKVTNFDPSVHSTTLISDVQRRITFNEFPTIRIIQPQHS